MDDRRLSIRLAQNPAYRRARTQPNDNELRSSLLLALCPPESTTVMMPTGPTDTTHPWGEAANPYQEMGGDEAVRALSETFYDIIEAESPNLRAMLPANTKNTRTKFYMYLSGWLGGPPLYEAKWGHPRLRMRHMPFVIGEAEATEWMRCMEKAIDTAEIGEPLRSFLVTRFAPLADHMKNQPN